MASQGRAIYLIGHGEQLVEMREATYDSEDLLQRLLATYPNLLAGDQMDLQAPRRWLLVTREASVPGELAGSGRWSLDHLFLDQDAVPTLVEVKRSTDTRIRREVVGQMLDYAANAVVYWPLEHVKAQFERRCELARLSPDDELSALLGPEGVPAEFWQQVKTNLQAGRIRMVFVADEIPAEVRRIVEFLNQQMDPAEVLAVEIKQYQGEGLRTLVPTVLGQTAEAMQRKSAGTEPGHQWDEESFFADIVAKGHASDAPIARKILEWAKRETTRVWWGRGRTYASFVPQYFHGDEKHQLFNVWASGKLEFYFYWYAYKPPFNDEGKRLELLAKLNEIPGVALSPSTIALKPSVPIALFADDKALQSLFEIFRWFMSEVRSSGR